MVFIALASNPSLARAAVTIPAAASALERPEVVAPVAVLPTAALREPARDGKSMVSDRRATRFPR